MSLTVSYNKDQNFNDIIFVKKLGKGTYGKVKSYIIPTGETVAIKKMCSDFMSEGLSSTTIKELHTLRTMIGCTNILQLFGVDMYIENGATIVNIMISCHTSDMSVFLQTIPVSERIKYSTSIINQLLNGLYQMWSHNIMHRDIKPHNILMDYQYSTVLNELTETPQCYYGDMGLSRQFPYDNKFNHQRLTKEVYTAIYRPPEILMELENYNDNADVYALGLVIIEYFTGVMVFKENSDFLNLKSLGSNLINPYIFTQHSDLTQLHDHINAEKIIRNNMNSHHFDSIPKDILTLFPKMLQINPQDRVHISNLVPNVLEPIPDRSIKRGSIYESSNINDKMVYITIEWMISCCKMLKLQIRTTICAIDMIQRIISNYQYNRDKLQLISVACMSLASKLNEIYAPELNDFVFITNKTYTVQEIKEIEIIVAKQLDYVFISPDIDPCVARFISIESNKLQHKELKRLFQKLKEKDLYCGTMSYTEMITYI